MGYSVGGGYVSIHRLLPTRGRKHGLSACCWIFDLVKSVLTEERHQWMPKPCAIIEGLTCSESFHILEILGGGSGVYLVACSCGELNSIATNS